MGITVLSSEQRPVLRVGTTGDYRPFTWLRPDGQYEGLDIEWMKRLGRDLGFRVAFVATSWPHLHEELTAGAFEAAIGGISSTRERRQTFLVSEVYRQTGKTILCRSEDAGHYRSLDDLDRPSVRVMFNPGGTNEAFVRRFLTHAAWIYHEQNGEIPARIAAGEADVMMTETVEAAYHAARDPRLRAPLLTHPFTHDGFAVLLAHGQDGLLRRINAYLAEHPPCVRSE